MILTAHQPAYMPWLGYFDKIIKSDIFIFLDSVQYERNSFTNRNKIKTPKGAIWLTVPVKTKGHMSSTLNKLLIDRSQDWQNKHLASIYANYKNAYRFTSCFSKLQGLFNDREYDYLADLCYDQLLFWLNEIHANTKVVRSSELQIGKNKSELILELCKHFHANHYVSGALGKNYLDEERFKKNGISIEYQDYKHPIYPQMWNTFIPNLSVLDFWMNTDQYCLITGGNI